VYTHILFNVSILIYIIYSDVADEFVRG